MNRKARDWKDLSPDERHRIMEAIFWTTIATITAGCGLLDGDKVVAGAMSAVGLYGSIGSIGLLASIAFKQPMR